MGLMILGSACEWRTRAELRQAIGAAPVVRRADEYVSEALRITRVATRTVGAYFILTEAGRPFPEDWTALQRLDDELRAPWRNRVVESDNYGHPHKWFPMSDSFRVHLVHPAYHPDWGDYGRQVFGPGYYDAIRVTGRSIRKVPTPVRASAA